MDNIDKRFKGKVIPEGEKLVEIPAEDKLTFERERILSQLCDGSGFSSETQRRLEDRLNQIDRDIKEKNTPPPKRNSIVKP